MSALVLQVQRGLFPPWIAGLTVFLVGVTLTGVGIKVHAHSPHAGLPISPRVESDLLRCCTAVATQLPLTSNVLASWRPGSSYC